MAGNSNSGRRRKPEALRELHGSVTRPHHRNRPEPKYAIEAPDPPATLSKDARTEWDRIVPLLITQRLLTRVDLACLTNYCTLFGLAEQYRRDMAADDFQRTYIAVTGDIKEHPGVKALRQTVQQMRAYLTELGLTPATRGKVSPAPGGDDDQPRGFGALEERLQRKGKVVRFNGGSTH